MVNRRPESSRIGERSPGSLVRVSRSALLAVLVVVLAGLGPAGSHGEDGVHWVGGPLEVAWTDDAGRAVSVPLLTSGDRLVVTTTDKRVLCYDLPTGKKVWRRRFKADLPTAPAILSAEEALHGSRARAGGRLFLQVGVEEDGRLYALRADDGEDVWKLPSHPRAVHLLVSQGRFFTIDLAGNLQCLDPDDGSPLWDRDGFGWDPPGLVPGEDALYVLARTDSLFALDPGTGARIWAAHVPGRFAARPLLAEGRLFLTSVEGQGYEVRIGDGAVRAESEPRRFQQLLTPVRIGGRVLTVSSDGWVEASGVGIGEDPAASADGGADRAVDRASGADGGADRAVDPGAGAAGGADRAVDPGAGVAGGADRAVDPGAGADGGADQEAAPGADAATALGGGWVADLGESVRGMPIAVGGLLLVPTSGGRLVALRADVGAQVWSLGLGERLATAPILTERYLVVATNQGDVYAYTH